MRIGVCACVNACVCICACVAFPHACMHACTRLCAHIHTFIYLVTFVWSNFISSFDHLPFLLGPAEKACFEVKHTQ